MIEKRLEFLGFIELTLQKGMVIFQPIAATGERIIMDQRLPAVANFRRWIGATPPEVFFCGSAELQSRLNDDPKP